MKAAAGTEAALASARAAPQEGEEQDGRERLPPPSRARTKGAPAGRRGAGRECDPVARILLRWYRSPMAHKGAKRTIPLTRKRRTKLERAARMDSGAGRSKGKRIRLREAAGGKAQAEELLRRLERLQAAREHADEVWRRRRED